MPSITTRRLAIALAAASTLFAPAAPAAGASFAGGALTSAAPLVSVRVADVGSGVEVAGEAIVRCAGGSAVDERLVVRTHLTPAGTFAGTATRSYRVSSKETRSVRVTVAGKIVGSRVDGTLRIAANVRRTKERPLACDSRDQRWAARGVPVAVGAPGGPVPGTYYGATTQRGRYLPYPVALRVSPGRVDAAIYRLRRRCRGAVSDEIANNSPATPIRPDGSFSLVQRYSQPFTDAVEYFTFRLSGRFFAAGARGTVRSTSVLRDLKTGKVIGRCDSGSLVWTAAR
jgi:hypothetical protein